MTKFSIDNAGWLETVEVIRSPNFDTRPDNTKIKLVVVHGISLPPAEYGGRYIRDFFCNQLDKNADEYFVKICDMKVSAHCLIERDGNIVQFVSLFERAWHAGVSSWHGEANCNDFSIGIELEGTDECAYTDSQYLQLNRLLTCLIEHFPEIDRKTVCGHSDIAPGRKTDPGRSFDWNRVESINQA